MGGVAGLLPPDNVVSDLDAASKKHALELMAEFAASRVRIESRRIFSVLLDRERLGSTGVGRGIAIPHAKVEGLEGIEGFLMRAAKAVPFEAIDDEPVDLFFVLLAPVNAGAEHLKALARVSRTLRDRNLVDALREAPNAPTMHDLATR